MTVETKREITYLEALREAMTQEMRTDKEVFLIGEDVGTYGGAFGVSKGMLEEFGPERVRDTPISEAAIAGAATGAALMGMRPIMEIMFMDFLTISTNQLVNAAAKMRFMFGGKCSIPMVIRAPSGSGTGAAAQHSQSLEAWFMHVPGLVVVAPSTPFDAKGLLAAAIRDDNPVIFLEHKMLYLGAKGPVPDQAYAIPLGKADVKREGRDVTVVATQMMVQRALSAASELEKDGISVEVIDPRTLVPLDLDTVLASVRKTNRLVVAHEAVKRGGFGAELSALVTEHAFDHLDAPVARVGARAVPMPYNDALERAVIPSQQDIIEAVRGVL